MADFQLRVSAETQEAEKKLGGVQRLAEEATKLRQIKIEIPNYSDVSKNFADLKKDVTSATNGIQEFYRVASKLPVGPINNINEVAGQIRAVGTAAGESSKSVGDAGAVIRGTLDTAGKAAETLVGKLTRVAFSLYAINEAVRITQSAFGGLFKETIGREIQLRETILKTQTTLASTNKVFKGSEEITDPYEKIVSLTGEVEKRIDSIRERSIALAGVTSNDVIEVFGIVASQVGQIGGGLKEAEDLAINFAAALGTFGIPLYQARQEIGSILRGDITMDSYLAKSLGITNEDIAKAKTEAGGVVKFLEDRLAAAVAGQRIAAEGFAGVVSNIKDLSELINQSFGRGLLDPLIDGLSKVFGFLFSIRKELFSIASQAGSSLGNLLSIGFGRTSGASGGARRTEGGGGGAGSRGTTSARTGARSEGFGADDVLKGVEAAIKRVTIEVNKALDSVYLQLATITERLTNAFGGVTKGLAALALGLLSLKLEQLKAVIGAFEALSPALLSATKGLSGFLVMWGELLRLPIVQEISQLSANMQLLQMIGVIPLIKAGFLLKGVLENWSRVTEFVVTQFNKLRAIIGGLIAYIGTIAVAASTAGQRLLTAWQPAGVALKALKSELEQVVVQLNAVGAAAQQAGSKIGSLNTEGKAAGGGIVGLIGNFIKFNLMMFAISATLGLILERFSAWKEAQDKLASDKRAEEALRRLNTTYKNVGDSADEATKRAKAFEESLVNSKYDEAVQRLEDVRKKIEEIKDLTSGKELDLGDYARRVAQLFNPANFDAFLDKRPGELFSEAVLRKRLEQEKHAETEKAKWAQEINEKSAANTIRLEAQNRSNLEKEIGDLRRQIDNDIFQKRQEAAQKEVDIFRAAGELRIFQIEQANKKLIEGQEGASRAAIEALNTYITTKERGELEIASASRSLQIELANMEHELGNYRLELEKKIAEIRRKSGENDMKLANARRTLESQPLAVGGNTGLVQGNTGTSSSGDHFHVAGAGSEAEARAIFANAGKLTTTDRPGSPRSGGRTHAGYDLAGAPGTPLALSAGYVLDPRNPFVRDPNGLGGNYANVMRESDQKRYKIMHLRDPGKSWTPGAVGSTATPKLEDVNAVTAPSAAEYEKAVGAVASRMKELQSLQAQLINAKTEAEFKRIAEALIPKLDLEEYDNQIMNLEESMKALMSVSADVYDPDRMQIMVEKKTKELILERERKQLLDDASSKLKDGKITQEKYNELVKQIKERQTQHLKDLDSEVAKREKILQITRKQAAVQGLQSATGAIPFDVKRARAQSASDMARAYAGDDPYAARRIEAEQKIAEKRIELEQDRLNTEADVQEKLRKFAEETRKAALELGAIDAAAKRFIESMQYIREASQAIVGPQKDMLKEVLMGSDLKEAVAAMSKQITDRVLSLALDYAFKPVEKMMEDAMKKFFNIQNPEIAVQEENTAAIRANTEALIAASTGAGAVTKLPVQPYGGYTLDQLEGLTESDQNKVLEQAFAGYGNSMMKLTDVATTTGTKAQEAANQSEKGFNKFLGGMMGVATGALAIAGGISQLQEGGTSNTLAGIGSILLGLGGAVGGLGSMGLFGKKAGGGPIASNRPYLVGENGPELMFSGTNGTMVPNNRIREAMGSSANGGSGSTSLNMTFQTTSIGGVEYVSREQLEEAMASTRRQAARDGAKRGMSMTLDRLQQSPGTRSRLGLR